jgi:hypothetical protein
MFEYWADLWRSGAAMSETAFLWGETLQASRKVVDARCRTIARASRDPLHADHGELARMVPEKMAAFSKAGAAVLGDVHDLQVQAMAHMQQMLGIALAGRAPTRREAGAIAARSGRMIKRAAASGGKALAPVHRTATGNAKRLAKKR